eukprot:SAG22_NODE_8318_length_665_cov_0.814488_1_plen_65_part_00
MHDIVCRCTLSRADHGHNVSIAWDPAGTQHYPNSCKGMCVWIDGQLKVHSSLLQAVNLSLGSLS